jgi:Ice-binding-like
MLFQRIEPSNGSPAPTLGRVSWRTLATMAVAFLPLFAPARAKADLSLGQAGQYAIIGNTVELDGGPTLTGSVAVNGNLVTNGGQPTISGTLIVNGTSSDPASISASLSGASSDLTSAIAAYNSLSATQSPSTLNISGNGGVNVVNLSSIGGAVTLTGSSSDYFIIKVSGAVDFEGGSGVMLMGGLTANHVLFDVTGNVKLGGSNTVSGTILSTGGSINIGGGSIVKGALIDLESMITDVKSDSAIQVIGTNNLFVAPIAAPEPAPFVKAISGLATIGIWGFFRRKRSKSK